MINIKNNGKVEIVFDLDSKEQVYLVGDFNEWDEKNLPMKYIDGKWKLELKLKPGEYEYKYLADGTWYIDTSAHKYTQSVWGDESSVLVVNAVDPVCGMRIKASMAYSKVKYHHTDYYLCCPKCLAEFENTPQKYV